MVLQPDHLVLGRQTAEYDWLSMSHAIKLSPLDSFPATGVMLRYRQQ